MTLKTDKMKEKQNSLSERIKSKYNSWKFGDKTFLDVVDNGDFIYDSIVNSQENEISKEDFIRICSYWFLKGYQSGMASSNDDKRTREGYRNTPYKYVEELIQNVDDCEYDEEPVLSILIDEEENKQTVTFKYNEKGFKKSDVWSLSSRGESTKEWELMEIPREKGIFYRKKTGRLGTGFKSVFSIDAEQILIHINSNGYTFYYDSEIGWVPIYEKLEEDKIIKNGTEVKIEIINYRKGDNEESDIDIFSRLRSTDKNTFFKENPFLFLRKLSSIEVKKGEEKCSIKIEREGDTLYSEEIFKINENDVDKIESGIRTDINEQYYKAAFDHIRYVVKCGSSKEDIVNYVKHTRMVSLKEKYCNIAVCAPVIKSEDSVAIKKDGIEYQSLNWEGALYATFPLRQHEFSMPIAIDAPFYTNEQRKKIDYSDGRNIELLRAVFYGTFGEWSRKEEESTTDTGVLGTLFAYLREITDIRMDLFFTGESQKKGLFDDNDELNKDANGNKFINKISFSIGGDIGSLGLFRSHQDRSVFISYKDAIKLAVLPDYSRIESDDERKKVIAEEYWGSILFKNKGSYFIKDNLKIKNKYNESIRDVADKIKEWNNKLDDEENADRMENLWNIFISQDVSEEEFCKIFSWFRYQGLSKGISGNTEGYLKKQSNKEYSDWSFINEILQNADDCIYDCDEPKLGIQIKNKSDKKVDLIVKYNEIGFTKEDVMAVSDYENSQKSGRKDDPPIEGVFERSKTGKKGLGFKSYFAVPGENVCVHVKSNGFYFAIYKRLSYIVPIWDKDFWGKDTDSCGTTVYIEDIEFTDNNEDCYDLIKKAMGCSDQTGFFASLPILFLRKIKTIEVGNYNEEEEKWNLKSKFSVSIKKGSDPSYEGRSSLEYHDAIDRGIIYKTKLYKKLTNSITINLIDTTLDEPMIVNAHRIDLAWYPSEENEENYLISALFPIMTESDNNTYNKGLFFTTLPIKDTSIYVPIAINAPFELNDGRSNFKEDEFESNKKLFNLIIRNLIPQIYDKLSKTNEIDISGYIPAENKLLKYGKGDECLFDLRDIVLKLPILRLATENSQENPQYISYNEAVLFPEKYYEWPEFEKLAKRLTGKYLIDRSYNAQYEAHEEMFEGIFVEKLYESDQDDPSKSECINEYLNKDIDNDKNRNLLPKVCELLVTDLIPDKDSPKEMVKAVNMLLFDCGESTKRVSMNDIANGNAYIVSIDGNDAISYGKLYVFENLPVKPEDSNSMKKSFERFLDDKLKIETIDDKINSLSANGFWIDDENCDSELMQWIGTLIYYHKTDCKIERLKNYIFDENIDKDEKDNFNAFRKHGRFSVIRQCDLKSIREDLTGVCEGFEEKGTEYLVNEIKNLGIRKWNDYFGVGKRSLDRDTMDLLLSLENKDDINEMLESISDCVSEELTINEFDFKEIANKSVLVECILALGKRLLNKESMSKLTNQAYLYKMQEQHSFNKIWWETAIKLFETLPDEPDWENIEWDGIDWAQWDKGDRCKIYFSDNETCGIPCDIKERIDSVQKKYNKDIVICDILDDLSNETCFSDKPSKAYKFFEKLGISTGFTENGGNLREVVKEYLEQFTEDISKFSFPVFKESNEDGYILCELLEWVFKELFSENKDVLSSMLAYPNYRSMIMMKNANGSFIPLNNGLNCLPATSLDKSDDGKAENRYCCVKDENNSDLTALLHDGGLIKFLEKGEYYSYEELGCGETDPDKQHDYYMWLWQKRCLWDNENLGKKKDGLINEILEFFIDECKYDINGKKYEDDESDMDGLFYIPEEQNPFAFEIMDEVIKSPEKAASTLRKGHDFNVNITDSILQDVIDLRAVNEVYFHEKDTYVWYGAGFNSIKDKLKLTPIDKETTGNSLRELAEDYYTNSENGVKKKAEETVEYWLGGLEGGSEERVICISEMLSDYLCLNADYLDKYEKLLILPASSTKRKWIEFIDRCAGNRSLMTVNGIPVKSKSEVIIANLLYFAGIEYEYEKKLDLKVKINNYDEPLKPDFTIMINDKPVIWEHCGMMGKKDYAEKWKLKKQSYEANGYSTYTLDEDKTFDEFYRSNKNKPILIVTEEDYDKNEFPEGTKLIDSKDINERIIKPIRKIMGIKIKERRYDEGKIMLQGIELEEVRDNDIEQVHKMQIASFMPLYEKYHDECSPAIETVERVKARAKDPNREYFFILKDGVRVGVINIGAKQDDGSVLYISPIFIIPEYQNRGIGYAAIMKAISMYPEVKTWQLDTIKQEAGNCHLYEKCGFVRNGQEMVINDKMTLVGYELNRA